MQHQYEQIHRGIIIQKKIQILATNEKEGLG